MEGMSEDNFCAVGIDIGGTKIAAGLVAFPELRVLERRQIRTASQGRSAPILEDLRELTDQLFRAAKTHSITVGAIGIGICELVDRSGKVVSACSIPSLDPLLGDLNRLAPTMVEADVRAAAFAEALFGSGRAYRQFLYLTIGTGISCSLMIEGRPFLGARGLTGTLASSPLPRLHPTNPTNAEENSGMGLTLEDVASGRGLAARFTELTGEVLPSAQEVCARAAAGHPEALAVVRGGAEALGAAAGWLVNILDPEALVIGGGLGLSGGLYWDAFEHATRAHIWSELQRDLPMVRAGLGENSGMIGAAAAAWKNAS